MGSKRHIKVTRDLVLFVFGLVGVTYETVVSHVDRPSLLFVFGACIGLPAFLRSDERKGTPPPPEPPPLPPPPPKPAPRPHPPVKKKGPVKKAAKKGTAPR